MTRISLEYHSNRALICLGITKVMPENERLSVLFATAQIEVFKALEGWIEFAKQEIDEWPET